LDDLARVVTDSFSHHHERDVRLVEASLDAATKDARIQDLERQLAELQIARDEGLQREAQLEDQVEDLHWALANANEMLAQVDQHFAQAAGQGQAGDDDEEDPEEIEGVSSMDTEHDLPPLDHPASPADSIASVNDLDDF